MKKKKFKQTRKPSKTTQQLGKRKPEKEIRKEKMTITLPTSLTVKELSHLLGKRPNNLIKIMGSLGVKTTTTEVIDYETAALVAHELGYETILIEEKPTLPPSSIELPTPKEIVEEKPKEKFIPKAPVVTVMGHIDHGKTTLLDAIRNTRVVEEEYGGITQSIGAYKVNFHGKEIVFIDTPGHEAFTQMRSRGAKVTDIVVLVVDAVDGVMPQTVEAINHARAANVPIIVAINKIDLPNANPYLVKQTLSRDYNLIPEEWGGDTLYQEISAKMKINIDKLLELILLKAETMNLKTSLDGTTSGTIIESKILPTKGIVATVLLQKGVLKIGDYFLAGDSSGKVKAIFDEKQNKLEKAEPVIPIEILGFDSLPLPGDTFTVVKDREELQKILDEKKKKQKVVKEVKRPTFEDLALKKVNSLNLIIKADNHGSLEAILSSLSRIPKNEVEIKITHSGVGSINESDVYLASVTNSMIIGFNVVPTNEAEKVMKNAKINFKLYRIIYDLIDEVKKAVEGLLPPKVIERVIGKAIVKQTFQISKVGTVAGCYVESGKIKIDTKIRLIRDGNIIYDGTIASLRRFKTDVKEVVSGLECGLALKNFQDIKIGDIIESYETEIIKQTL